MNLRLKELPPLERKPILLAAVLNHWQHKGPAEIPSKRVFTYQYCQWYAQHHGLPFRCPPAHPFNPLRALRLAIACGCEPAAVDAVFHFIWGQGGDLTDDEAFLRLGRSLGLEDPLAAIARKEIKDALRIHSEAAVDVGVFGVPTLVVDDHLFFGNDATDMALAYCHNPAVFDDPEMKRAAALPVGVSRI